MKIRIREKVFIDTEVSISIEDITQTIVEAAEKMPSNASVHDLLVLCWKTLEAFTDEQIELIGPANAAANRRRASW